MESNTSKCHIKVLHLCRFYKFRFYQSKFDFLSGFDGGVNLKSCNGIQRTEHCGHQIIQFMFVVVSVFIGVTKVKFETFVGDHNF